MACQAKIRYRHDAGAGDGDCTPATAASASSSRRRRARSRRGRRSCSTTATASSGAAGSTPQSRPFSGKPKASAGRTTCFRCDLVRRRLRLAAKRAARRCAPPEHEWPLGSRGREGRQVTHLPARTGVFLAVKVQFHVGKRQHCCPIRRAVRPFVAEANLPSRPAATSGRRPVASRRRAAKLLLELARQTSVKGIVA